MVNRTASSYCGTSLRFDAHGCHNRSVDVFGTASTLLGSCCLDCLDVGRNDPVGLLRTGIYDFRKQTKSEVLDMGLVVVVAWCCC